MIFVNKRSLLKGTLVKEAMRRQLIKLPPGESIKKSINTLIKYKVNTLLLANETEQPKGIISRTDIMAAYYAGLPLDLDLEQIISRHLLTCLSEDELETGLEIMKENQVHQLYVQNEQSREIQGYLTYYDIVGLLYRYCRACKRSTQKNRDNLQPLKVEEVMTKDVSCCYGDQSLEQVIEIISENRIGAVLVLTDQDKAAGVISTTDLILSYSHSLSLDTSGSKIMSSPVFTCEKSAPLTSALQKMLLKDTKRIFVSQNNQDTIVGILSLSDAARFRSGSCRACQAGRIMAG